VQCPETAALRFLIFELLPFVNFHISFLFWPFFLSFIVHKATHPTGGVLVYNISCPFEKGSFFISLVGGVQICQEHISYMHGGISMKLHRNVHHYEKLCSTHEPGF
jgi:TRAP-type mannitol/chloroaromatic compound transport system permease small subunit